MVIFSALHPVAIYVPYIIATLFITAFIYKLTTHKSIKSFVIAGLSVCAVNLAVALPLLWQIKPLTKTMVDTMVSNNQSIVTNLNFLVMVDITPLVLGILVTASVILLAFRKQLSLTVYQKYLLVILGAISLVLVGAGMVGTVEWHARQIIDGSIFLSLFASVIIGIIWQNQQKLSWAIMPTMVVTGLNVINTGIAWVK